MYKKNRDSQFNNLESASIECFKMQLLKERRVLLEKRNLVEKK